LRWGIIGPGRIADEFATALRAVELACLYAVASRDKLRAEIFAKTHGAARCYDSYQALIDDPSVDAVYIATPHRFHFENARDCIRAGKAVFCEKPLTVNAAETNELIKLAEEAGVFLMEAMRTRFLPVYQQVRHWLDVGEIGEVERVSSFFGFEFPRNFEDRLLNQELAGGVLLDMGVYNLSMSQWLFAAEPESFTAHALIGDTGVDEHLEVKLDYSGGRISTFTNSMTTRQTNDFSIYGGHGLIRVEPMFWNATRVSLSKGEKPAHYKQTQVVTREFRATGMEYEIEEAQSCIREGRTESPRMPLSDTLSTMRSMDILRTAIGLRYSFE
jgi:predicted dehydrogenase